MKIRYSIIENTRANGTSYFTVWRESFWFWKREQLKGDNERGDYWTTELKKRDYALAAIDKDYAMLIRRKGYLIVKRKIEYIIKQS